MVWTMLSISMMGGFYQRLLSDLAAPSKAGALALSRRKGSKPEQGGVAPALAHQLGVGSGQVDDGGWLHCAGAAVDDQLGLLAVTLAEGDGGVERVLLARHEP